MNTHELKAKWGKYCDTDKLVAEMATWFNKYRMRNTPNGICSMLDTFFTNKEELIKLFEKSDNYIGDMRIMLDTTMARYSDRGKVNTFVSRFPGAVESKKAILKDVDGTGKKLHDYIHVGQKTVSIEDLVNNKISKAKFDKWWEKFDCDGYTIESNKENDAFLSIINVLRAACGATITSSSAASINVHNANLKIAEGTKTARVFNKVCAAYGVDKLPKYNKLFAEYADMVSEAKRNIKFYISINPLDYLNMSIGHSWNSCHAPNHGYFQGTVSYMLDEVSIITFVHNDIPKDIINEGKIYRNMFHFKDGVLIQSRVYPQGNDGCTNLYDEFRGMVQNELAQNLGVQNNWHVGDVNMRTAGRQYPDYNHKYSGVNVSYVGSKKGTNEITIGHINICPYCGQSGEISSSKIYHESCRA